MVFKEGWIDKAIDWVCVICFLAVLLALVVFAANQPGGLPAVALGAASAVGVWMAIRGFIIVVDWLDK